MNEEKHSSSVSTHVSHQPPYFDSKLGRWLKGPQPTRAQRKAQFRRMFSGQQDPQPVHDPTLADQPVGSATGLQFVAAQVDPTFRYVVFLAGDGRTYNVATKTLLRIAGGPGFNLSDLRLTDEGKTVLIGQVSIPSLAVIEASDYTR